MNNLVTIIKLLALTISLFSFVFYLVRYIIKYREIPESISQTWLVIRNKIEFTWFIWGTFLPFLAFCFDPIKPLLIIGIGLTVLVGSFPMIYYKLIKAIHMIVIISGIILCYFSLWYYFEIIKCQIIVGVSLFLMILIMILLNPCALIDKYWIKEEMKAVFWSEVILYLGFFIAISSVAYVYVQVLI